MPEPGATDVRALDHWYDGGPQSPSSGRYLDSVDPRTGSLSARVADGSPEDVDAAVQSATTAAREWRRVAPAERGRILVDLSRAIRACADELVALEVAETGKPPALAFAEVEGAAAYFEFYGGVVNAPAGETIDLGPGFHSYTQREPFGVVGIITPWNLPLNQAARAAAPALAVGNAVVLKPSSLTSATSIRLAELAAAAGLPSGVLNVVLGGGATVGRALASHPDVKKVAFTGSVEVGRELGAIAADRIIPMTLELGGKSANIVFEDADLERAAKGSVRAFTQNAGQVCSAGTRLLVSASVHNRLVAQMVDLVKAMQPGIDVGPLISGTQFDVVRRYLELAESEGAVPLTGGHGAVDATAPGFFIPPTILVQATNGMRIAREEIFGPVLVVIPFESEEEAVAMANDSDYGLVAGVWTQDISRALRVADQLEAGQIFVNSWSTGAVQTPFGGFKASGYGREKGVEALHHYSQLKSVTVAL